MSKGDEKEKEIYGFVKQVLPSGTKFNFLRVDDNSDGYIEVDIESDRLLDMDVIKNATGIKAVSRGRRAFEIPKTFSFEHPTMYDLPEPWDKDITYPILLERFSAGDQLIKVSVVLLNPQPGTPGVKPYLSFMIRLFGLAPAGSYGVGKDADKKLAWMTLDLNKELLTELYRDALVVGLAPR